MVNCKVVVFTIFIQLGLKLIVLNVSKMITSYKMPPSRGIVVLCGVIMHRFVAVFFMPLVCVCVCVCVMSRRRPTTH